MKKLAFSLIASLAIFQSGFAAVTALSESLNEYDAVVSAIGTSSEFSSTEFVVDIKRVTEEVNILGTVRYRIVTRDIADLNAAECGCEHHHRRDRTHQYLAVLDVAANTIPGSNIITVISIEPISRTNR